MENFNAKIDLYEYTHDYYFGFFKTKSMVRFISVMKTYNPKYTFDFFSLELYKICLKKNIKPSKKTAQLILYTEWKKIKNTPSNLKPTNIYVLNDITESLIYDNPTKELEEDIIENADSKSLVKKICKYVQENYTERENNIFNLYFSQKYTIKELEELIGLKKSSIYLIVNKIRKDLTNKFGNEYFR